jgi:hypothetical protein
MARKAQRAQMVLPGPNDAIRIVPLHVPPSVHAPAPMVAAAPPPKLTYRGGPLLSAVQVFTVFWGSAWGSQQQKSLVSSLNKFFTYILKSSLMKQMGEYKVTQYPIGNGKFVGSTTVTTPAPAHSVSDTAIRHMLQQEISTNATFPKPTPNMLYFVYLPPGVVVVQGGSKSCQAFCGYHDNINGQIFYAVMPYPNCQGCLGGLNTLDALTSTSSHELCEAITDPIPGQGWYDDVNGEIGDICAWKSKKIGAYEVQLEWSNKAKKCV